MRDLTDASPAAIAAEVPASRTKASARKFSPARNRRRVAPGRCPRLVDDPLHVAPPARNRRRPRRTCRRGRGGAPPGGIALERPGRLLGVAAAGDQREPFFEGEEEPCIDGGALALGAYFGRPTEDLARRLVSEQLEDGGWNCEAPKSTRSSFHTTICVLEGLRVRGCPRVRVSDCTHHRGGQTARRGVSSRAWPLRRRSTGEVANPAFLELAFPPRYRSDILRALDYLRATGAPPDARVADALHVVEGERYRAPDAHAVGAMRSKIDGRWLLDRAYDEALTVMVGE